MREEYVNVKIVNAYNETTESVADVPIKNDNGEVIGHLTKADKDYIYGVIKSNEVDLPKRISYEIITTVK